MASTKMKKKLKNAFLNWGSLKSSTKLKRVMFYTKTQRQEVKKVDKQ